MKNSKLVKLAEEAITEYVANGKRAQLPSDLTSEMKERKGVFVSIKEHGQLRGCIGTIRPTQENVAEEIISNAISACSHDPRFSPVRPEELKDLDISVDVLDEEERVSSLDELNPEKYGVIVKKGHRTGLLLPNLDGIDTAEQQVNIARQKAGLTRNEDVELFRFEVKRYR